MFIPPVLMQVGHYIIYTALGIVIALVLVSVWSAIFRR